MDLAFLPLQNMCIMFFEKGVRTRVLLRFGDKAGDGANGRKTLARSFFFILTSACIIVFLIGCAINVF